MRPLPGIPVIRDLVVDLEPFYRQYRAVTPYLVNHDPEPEVERRQSPADRDQRPLSKGAIAAPGDSSHTIGCIDLATRVTDLLGCT